MKIRDYVRLRAGKRSIRLSFTQETINFFLRDELNPQGNTRPQQALLHQSEYGHITDPQFFSSFTHCEGVPLQRPAVFRFVHPEKNGKHRERRTQRENVGMSERKSKQNELPRLNKQERETAAVGSAGRISRNKTNGSRMALSRQEGNLDF